MNNEWSQNKSEMNKSIDLSGSSFMKWRKKADQLSLWMEPAPRSQKLRGKPTTNKAIPQFLAGAGEAKELLDLLFGGGGLEWNCLIFFFFLVFGWIKGGATRHCSAQEKTSRKKKKWKQWNESLLRPHTPCPRQSHFINKLIPFNCL